MLTYYTIHRLDYCFAGNTFLSPSYSTLHTKTLSKSPSQVNVNSFTNQKIACSNNCVSQCNSIFHILHTTFISRHTSNDSTNCRFNLFTFTFTVVISLAIPITLLFKTFILVERNWHENVAQHFRVLYSLRVYFSFHNTEPLS